MTYEVQFTRQAETDLDAIYQYYRLQFSEASARKVLKTLKGAISRLHQFPEAFINFDQKIGRQLYKDGNLHMIPSKHYLVFYLIRTKKVILLRILHSKTDYLNHLETLFNQED